MICTFENSTINHDCNCNRLKCYLVVSSLQHRVPSALQPPDLPLALTQDLLPRYGVVTPGSKF